MTGRASRQGASSAVGLLPTRRALAFGGTALLAGCGRRDVQQLQKGEAGRVARVQDGDLLYLDTGLAVRLVEIEAPAFSGRERLAADFANAARTLLEQSAVGRPAQLFYGGLARDSYERALAHVIARDGVGRALWQNGLMVRKGAARVRSFPDNAARAGRLYALENAARTENAGLWASPDHAVLRSAAALAPQSFALVEGRLAEMSRSDAESIAVFEDGAVRLLMGDRPAFESAPPELVADRPVRIRGRIVRRDGGSAMMLTHWEQIEALA